VYDEAKLREFYDADAPRRDSYDVHEWKQVERQRFLEEVTLNRGGCLLELGAGAGKDSLFFKEQGLNIVATDLSPEIVKLCKEKGLEARVMNYRSLAFPSENFDAVYAFNSLLHTPKKNLLDVLTGIRNILKPSGLFFLGVWGGESFEGLLEEDSYEPKRFFSFWEDRALLELVMTQFDLIYFRKVKVEVARNYHFQSLILRKT